MADEVLKQLPPALKASGLVLSGAPVLTTSNLATPAELAAVLPAGAADPVLTIKPVGATMDCPGACFAFFVAARLVSADRSTVLWSATLHMQPKASRFSDFSTPAGVLVQTLIDQMKKDALQR
ncbi:hypothetical protein HLB44_00220 [Aquincola sp. S2]|uniref:Uncharacterized protein n=1 Tax=Pseudaquabacterium terrae TaxID=2732868 RepID=A0ABX2EAQ1_9BURK|nr:hypothetical protein [Aquabacterium terrae]NRF65397.1 hypothetical protein [Aquabacterium terrae]